MVARLLKKEPQDIYTLHSSDALNMQLSKAVSVGWVSGALGAIQDVCSCCCQSQLSWNSTL